MAQEHRLSGYDYEFSVLKANRGSSALAQRRRLTPTNDSRVVYWPSSFNISFVSHTREGEGEIESGHYGSLT